MYLTLFSLLGIAFLSFFFFLIEICYPSVYYSKHNRCRKEAYYIESLLSISLLWPKRQAQIWT